MQLKTPHAGVAPVSVGDKRGNTIHTRDAVQKRQRPTVERPTVESSIPGPDETLPGRATPAQHQKGYWG